MISIVRAALSSLMLSFGVPFLAPGAALAQTGTDEVVVIRSDAEAYPIGKTFSLSRDRISLAGSQKVLMVDAQGAVRRFTAPFSGAISQAQAEGGGASSAVVAALASLLSDPNGRSELQRSGGVAPGGLPSPWAISVEHSGPACAPNDRLTLWRRDGAKDSRLVIDMGAGGKKARATWAQGAPTLPMPANLFTSGQTYLVKVDEQEVSLKLHIFSATPASPVETAVWMANAGCKAQALAMISSIQ